MPVIRPAKQTPPSYASGYAKSASESAHPNLWDGLVGAWMPSFGSTGGTLRDVSGNHNDASLSLMDPATDWVVSEQGLVLDTDTGNDRIILGNAEDLFPGPVVNASLCCWIKPITNVSSDQIPIGDQYVSGERLYIGIVNGKWGVGFGNYAYGNNFTGTPATATNDWTFLSLIITDGSAVLYVNGQETITKTTDTSVAASGPFSLGVYYFNGGRNGTLHGAAQHGPTKIYNRPLSTGEVNQLYRDHLAPFRQRRYFPISLQTEEPSDTSKIITVKRNKSDVEPSYKSGYAQSAGESAHPNLWEGLVGAWMPSLGITGGILRDVSENENHGTLTNMDPATGWVTTSKGLALDFDGVNDYVEVPDNESLSIATSDWTIVCLLKNLQGTTNTGKFEGIVQKGYFEANTGWEILRNGTNASGPIGCVAVAYGSQAQYGNTAMSSTDFSSIVWRKKGTNSTLWLNGNLDDETTLASKNEYSSPLVIGQRNLSAFSPGYFNGPISSVYIFDRALSPQEIKQLYVDPLAPFRKKQQVAFNAYPLTLLEKIRSVAKPTTTRALSVKKNSVPSYKAGYAKSASESANPGLWDGLRGAWYPQMGESGSTLMDLSGGKMNASRIGQIDWLQSNEDGGLTCDYFGRDAGAGDSSAFDIVNSSSVHPYGDIGSELTIICRVRRDINNTSVAEGNWYVGNTVFELRQETTTGCNVPFSVGQKAVATDEVYWSIGFTDNFTTNAEKVFSDVNVGNVNTWTHGAVTVSNNTVQWYSKGEPWGGGTISTATGDRSVGSVASNMQIGSGSASNGVKEFNEFGGRISEVLLYDRVLTHREIKQLYVDPLAPFRKKTTVGYQPSKELRGLFRT